MLKFLRILVASDSDTDISLSTFGYEKSPKYFTNGVMLGLSSSLQCSVAIKLQL